MRLFTKFCALSTALVLAATACKQGTETKTETGQEKPGVSLKVIEPPEDNLLVLGNVVDLGLKVSGIKIVAAKDDLGTGGTGHFHVFIDKDPVKEGEVISSGQPDIIHSADNPIKLTGLSVGQHKFTVVLGDKGHVRIGDIQATRTLKIEGPSLDASGPATAKSGEVVKINVTVQGVAIVPAAEDKSNKDGTAGHLHVFVNKDPPEVRPGGLPPIPSGDPAIIHTASTSIDIPPELLKVGENTIWVMLGWADHSPFEPPVLDKIIVTVS